MKLPKWIKLLINLLDLAIENACIFHQMWNKQNSYYTFLENMAIGL